MSSRQRVFPLSLPVLKAYISLTKPVAVGFIMLVTGAGMVLAANTVSSVAPYSPLFLTHGMVFSTAKVILACFLVGISAAGAFALNQYYERHLDVLMARAKNRAIPAGKLTPNAARTFGFIAFLFPLFFLNVLISPMSAGLTCLCGTLYVWAYTPLKTRTSLSTFVGAIPGALLPLMGWFAVRSDIDLNILFPTALLFIWQIPHALVIALRHKTDYLNAGMKQLPLIMGRTQCLKHLIFCSFLTGVLCLTPVIWVSRDLSYGMGTLLVVIITLIFAFRTHSHDNNLTTFFLVHLVSLPTHILLFLACS